MKGYTKILFLIFSGFVMQNVNAQITWNFGTSAASSAASGTIPANITAGAVTSFNSSPHTTVFIPTPAPTPVSNNAGASGAFSGNVTTAAGALNIATSGYIQVVLTPSAGFSVNITGINWGNLGIASTAGPTAYAIRTSIDNYGANIASGTLTANSAWALVTATVTSTTGPAGAPVTIRIFASGGTGTPTANTANWRVDDIKVTATAVSSPASTNAGTVNQIAKYLTANTLGNSVISETAGGDIGINLSTAPAAKLDVNGSLKIAGSLITGTPSSPGASGQVLTSNGAGFQPTWQTPAAGGSMVYPALGIAVSTGTAWGPSVANNSANWDNAFTDRMKWDGGATGLVAATGRTSLGLGTLATQNGTITDYLTTAAAASTYALISHNHTASQISDGSTIGKSVLTSTNPSAITFLQANANNTVSWLDAAAFRAAIGVSAGNSGWNVTGNTASATDFIGTINAQDLRFRAGTGTDIKMIIQNNTGNVGIGIANPAQQLEIAQAFRFPETTSSTTGVIYKGAGSFLHDYTNMTGGGDGSGRNIFLGKQAGNFTLNDGGLNYLGSGNVGIGNNALSALTTGYGNIGIGTQTLRFNTTGNNNVSIGHQSLLNNTSGYYNLGIGYGTLGNNTTGYQNAALGFASLSSNTTGGNNFAFGSPSLQYNTTGSLNIGMGNYSGHFNQTGQHNMAIGHYALYSNTVSYNTAIGDETLYDVTTGGNNTAVGYKTGRGITTGVNNTIIGANVSGLSPSLSNNIIIADGLGNMRINVDNNGNVGIGTNSPSAKLDVAGNTKISGTVSIGPVTTFPVGAGTNFKLAVAGDIMAEKVKVKLQTAGWPDYVFDNDYRLLSIKELEAFIQKNKHLPNVPSAAQTQKEGLDVGDNQRILLEKIEELTLYIIEQNKNIIEQNKKIEQLESDKMKLAELQKQLDEIKKLLNAKN